MRIVLGVLVVCPALLGCAADAPAPILPKDQALRQFLGVRTIEIHHQLPPGEDYFAIQLFEFEDGKYKGSTLLAPGMGASYPQRLVRGQVLWGNVEGKPQVTLSMPGTSTSKSAEFWSRLGGGLSYGGDPVDQESFRDFRIVGYASSNEPRDGKKNEPPVSSFEGYLQGRKYVGAVGIRSFASAKERDQGTRVE